MGARWRGPALLAVALSGGAASSSKITFCTTATLPCSVPLSSFEITPSLHAFNISLVRALANGTRQLGLERSEHEWTRAWAGDALVPPNPGGKAPMRFTGAPARFTAYGVLVVSVLHTLGIHPPALSDLPQAQRGDRSGRAALTSAGPSVSDGGMYLEFGVWSGSSLNVTAHLLRRGLASAAVAVAHAAAEPMVVGFDTFTGLPERWRRYDEGYFKLDRLPRMDSGVMLRKGLFNVTLPGKYYQRWYELSITSAY